MKWLSVFCISAILASTCSAWAAETGNSKMTLPPPANADLNAEDSFKQQLVAATRTAAQTGELKIFTDLLAETSEKHRLSPRFYQNLLTEIFTSTTLLLNHNEIGKLIRILLTHEPSLKELPLLCWAAKKRLIELAGELLADGFNVDDGRWYGMTALMFATKNNDAEMVRCLLKADPNLLLINYDGSTARKLTTSQEIKKLLREAKPSHALKAPNAMLGEILSKGLKMLERQIGGSQGIDAGLHCLQALQHHWLQPETHKQIFKTCKADYDKLESSELGNEPLNPGQWLELKSELRGEGISPGLIQLAEQGLNPLARCTAKLGAFQLTLFVGGLLAADRFNCKTPLGGTFTLHGWGFQPQYGIGVSANSGYQTRIILPLTKSRFYAAHTGKRDDFHGVDVVGGTFTPAGNVEFMGVGLSLAISFAPMSHKLVRSTGSYDFRYVLKAMGYNGLQ